MALLNADVARAPGALLNLFKETSISFFCQASSTDPDLKL